jgi:hypothetical protein
VIASGMFVGWRSGMRRVLVTRSLAAAMLTWGIAAVVASAEKHVAPFGAAGRALEGQVFGLILPLALLWTSTRVLEPVKLETATSSLARFGLSRRSVALGLILASMLAGAFLAAVAAAATAIFAHDPTAPSTAVDAITCSWIGALTAAAYAGLFALGATFGRRGGGRFAALGLDFILGNTSGFAAVLLPRAHAQNLLGGEPPLLLGQPASAALLVFLATAFAALAAARCAR